MKLLSVRLEDDEHAALKARAETAGLTVSAVVKNWIGSLGDGGVVPSPASPRPVPDLVGAPPSPPAPVQPSFLAAPVDDCPVCGHDRQASSHLGGQPCKFKIGRRNCGCTFEGF